MKGLTKSDIGTLFAVMAIANMGYSNTNIIVSVSLGVAIYSVCVTICYLNKERKQQKLTSTRLAVTAIVLLSSVILGMYFLWIKLPTKPGL